MTTISKPLKRRYKYRIYPTKEQEIALSQLFGCVRYVYNRMLGELKDAYALSLYTVIKHKVPSHFEMCLSLPVWKKEPEKLWLGDVCAQSLQASLGNLANAYKNAFKHKKGYPRFKNKFGVQTAEFSNQMYAVADGKLKLAKIDKHFRIKWSKTLPTKGITTCTIIKTPSGKCYASFIVEVPQTTTKGQGILGVDAGLTHLYTLSNGKEIQNPRHYVKAQKKLARLQRQHSRKKKGSKNREKSRIKVARLHEHTANQRRDHLHKLSTQLIRENQAICVENLKVANMVRNPRLAKHISDAGWGVFKRMLMYKANPGCKLYMADPFYPSTQLCHKCNKAPVTKVQLGVKQWTCLHCNTLHQRDDNAAQNLKLIAAHYHKVCKDLTENIVLVSKNGLID